MSNVPISTEHERAETVRITQKRREQKKCAEEEGAEEACRKGFLTL